jgi:hypothetical protein
MNNRVSDLLDDRQRDRYAARPEGIPDRFDFEFPPPASLPPLNEFVFGAQARSARRYLPCDVLVSWGLSLTGAGGRGFANEINHSLNF